MRHSKSHLPRPEFISQDRVFQTELNKRVSNFFRGHGLSPQATTGIKIKALILYVVFFALFGSFFAFPQSFLTTGFIELRNGQPVMEFRPRRPQFPN